MIAFDPTVIAELQAELPEEDLRRILLTFETDLTRLVSELTAAVAAQDSHAYLHAAHALAGAASAVGLVGLEHEARIAMDPGQPEPPAQIMPRLLNQAQDGLQALHAILG